MHTFPSFPTDDREHRLLNVGESNTAPAPENLPVPTQEMVPNEQEEMTNGPDTLESVGETAEESIQDAQKGLDEATSAVLFEEDFLKEAEVTPEEAKSDPAISGATTNLNNAHTGER